MKPVGAGHIYRGRADADHRRADVRADPGPSLRAPPAATVASPEQQFLRGWRSVVLAPIGDGQRRRRGSDGMRLAGAVLALVCCVLVIRYDSRIDRAITAVIHPPPRTITWLVTVVYQGVPMRRRRR